ncbi:Hypothetical Protein FCC1311_059152, partial [Hondaea fermentalgiana]
AVSRTVAPTSVPTTACPEGSILAKLEIGVSETGTPFCPGLVDFRVVLEHKLASSPNLGLEVSFSDTGETSYSPVSSNCSELADGSSMECVISANGTPPDADWALKFFDLSTDGCTLHDNYKVTMPAADDTECADYELTTLCANKEDSLVSVKASFGGELAATVQGLSSEARLWCEVRSSSEDTLASLSVFVDSSEGRVTCGNGVVVAEPHYIYIMSDTWTTPMYRVTMGSGSNAHELVCSPNDVDLATFGHRTV